MAQQVLSDTELVKIVDEAFDEAFEILYRYQITSSTRFIFHSPPQSINSTWTCWLLFSLSEDGWKEEKKNDAGDVVVSRKSKKGKKIYRITATIDVEAKKLADRLGKMDNITDWNKTLQKYQLLKRINDKVTVSYQVNIFHNF